MMKYNNVHAKNSISNRLKNTKFDFAGNLKYFLIAPLVLILVGAILLLTIGFNRGIDFTGGTIVNVVLGDQLENESYYNEAKNKIEEVLNENGLRVSLFQKTEATVNSSSEMAISIRYQDKAGLSEEEMNDLNARISNELLLKFGFDPENSEEAALVQDGQRIGATASSELVTNAFLSLLIVIAAILIYIIIRFEFTSGMAAILALFHDVMIMCVLTAIFRIEINSSFIAAIITIVGYSINNTIIIFDRIRENLKSDIYSKASNKTIVNASIKETLTRTMYTTITTLVTVVALAVIGVASIRQFSIPIIFGLIAGTYSSVFLAPGLWAIAYSKKKKRKVVETEEV